MDGAVELPFHLLLFYDVFGVKVEKRVSNTLMRQHYAIGCVKLV